MGLHPGLRVVPTGPDAAATSGGGAQRPATATVTVPATSANLGPGFDSFGLGLGLRDRVRVVAVEAPDADGPTVRCHVSGEGSEDVPRDGRHLVAATLRRGLAMLLPQRPVPALELYCDNSVPHGRGLGSSAAAIVAGLALAWELAAGWAAPATRANDREEWLVDRASDIEGHGDNAAAAVLGGAVVAWHDGSRYRAHRLEVAANLEVVTAVPGEVLPTHTARAMLPSSVPRADAVFTAARTALLVEGLRGRRDLLMAATEDRLHQDARGPAMPRTLALVGALREAGHPAVVSGAGPSVLVLGSRAADVAAMAGPGWQVSAHEDRRGLEVEDQDAHPA